MDGTHLSDVIARREESGGAYLEFIRSPSLSVGVYQLPAGGVDPQTPHTEDEVYYVVSGRATIRVGDEDRPVQSGSIVFVPAGIEHRFHTITDALTSLVCFGPAEYSRASNR